MKRFGRIKGSMEETVEKQERILAIGIEYEQNIKDSLKRLVGILINAEERGVLTKDDRKRMKRLARVLNERLGEG